MIEADDTAVELKLMLDDHCSCSLDLSQNSSQDPSHDLDCYDNESMMMDCCCSPPSYHASCYGYCNHDHRLVAVDNDNFDILHHCHHHLQDHPHKQDHPHDHYQSHLIDDDDAAETDHANAVDSCVDCVDCVDCYHICCKVVCVDVLCMKKMRSYGEVC